MIGHRTRLVALSLCVIGAALIWFNPSDQLRSGTRAISLVVLAGVGALLASRGLLRRLTAIVVMLASLGLVAGGTAMAMIGGAVASIGALIALLTVKTWPSLGGRYQRTATSASRSESTDLWTALDRGEDPTAR
jgi:hypothetical protein